MQLGVHDEKLDSEVHDGSQMPPFIVSEPSGVLGVHACCHSPCVHGDHSDMCGLCHGHYCAWYEYMNEQWSKGEQTSWRGQDVYSRAPASCNIIFSPMRLSRFNPLRFGHT